jgi:hypothetical protein
LEARMSGRGNGRRAGCAPETLSTRCCTRPRIERAQPACRRLGGLAPADWTGLRGPAPAWACDPQPREGAASGNRRARRSDRVMRTVAAPVRFRRECEAGRPETARRRGLGRAGAERVTVKDDASSTALAVLAIIAAAAAYISAARHSSWSRRNCSGVRPRPPCHGCGRACGQRSTPRSSTQRPPCAAW